MLQDRHADLPSTKARTLKRRRSQLFKRWRVRAGALARFFPLRSCPSADASRLSSWPPSRADLIERFGHAPAGDPVRPGC